MDTSRRLLEVPMAFNVLSCNGVLMLKMHKATTMLCYNDTTAKERWFSFACFAPTFAKIKNFDTSGMSRG